MKSRITTDLVLDALLMYLWRRKPQNKVLIHSDQGCQYTGHEWQTFLKQHNLECSMSRRGNCHDNAVAESFFQLLKRERIKYMHQELKPGLISLNILRCFIIQNGGMVPMGNVSIRL